MTPSDISGAQTSAMEIPRARGRGAGASAAKAAAAAAAQEAAAAAAEAVRADTSGTGDSGGQPAAQAAEQEQPGAGAGLAPTREVVPPVPTCLRSPQGRGRRRASRLSPRRPGRPAAIVGTGAAGHRALVGAASEPEQAGPARAEPSQAGLAYPGGVPPGGSALGAAAGVEPDVTAPPEPYEPVSGFDPMQGQPFEAVVLLDASSGSGVDIPARAPLSKVKDMPPGTSSYVSAGPIIQGVYCKNGHFDDPEALFCAICGISMNQQTLVPRPGERPPLGVLLLDDGAVFQLDSDYVVGREPSLDGSVADGKARPLRITDETGIVSRVHARVFLDGWRVLVIDLGSANGTRVLLPGQPADQPLVPQVPIVLATGSQVDLGGRGFRYESHRGR